MNAIITLVFAIVFSFAHGDTALAAEPRPVPGNRQNNGVVLPWRALLQWKLTMEGNVMRILFTALLALGLASVPARAESIKEIFQSIANDAPTGNGNGHSVFTLKTKFNKAKEKAKLKKEMNGESNGDCRYFIRSGIARGLKEIEKTWSDSKSAARLGGMNGKGMLKEIIYSDWDPDTGDSEYCSKAPINVYGTDGSVLDLEYDETD